LISFNKNYYVVLNSSYWKVQREWTNIKLIEWKINNELE